jgi:Uma2 family endonuclease
VGATAIKHPRARNTKPHLPQAYQKIRWVEPGDLREIWGVGYSRFTRAGAGLRSPFRRLVYPVIVQVVLPEQALPAKLTLNPELRMSDDQYYDFCMSNADVRFERTAQGEILIVPPAGPESDHRNVEVTAQLHDWAKRDRRGNTFGPSVEFILPSGAAYSPDAAWVSNERLAQFTKEQRRKFLRLCPEFVVDVMSPSDRLKAAQDKMDDWMANGVALGWLIDGDNQTVYIYRTGQTGAEKQVGAHALAGEGPVAGFELNLTDIWAGL